MELPYWVMAAGAVLLVVGYFGLAFQDNVQLTPDPENSDGNQFGETPRAGIASLPSESVAS